MVRILVSATCVTGALIPELITTAKNVYMYNWKGIFPLKHENKILIFQKLIESSALKIPSVDKIKCLFILEKLKCCMVVGTAIFSLYLPRYFIAGVGSR